MSSRRVLRTPLCDLLGIRYPIVQAGMGYVSRGRLAAEVSSAGGLGVVGTGHLSPDELRAELRLARQRTTGPIGAAIIYSPPDLSHAYGRALSRLIADQLDVVRDERVDVLIVGARTDAAQFGDLRAADTKILAIAASGAQARQVAPHVDAVVAQGQEASGNVGTVGTIVLVPHVVDLVEIPVLAAGGIADGRGIAAALLLGADGVYLGSRFLATDEAHAHDAYKDALVRLGDEGTIVTAAHSGVNARLIANTFTDEWSARFAEIEPYPRQLIEVGTEASYRARILGDVDHGSAPAGQSAALIGSVVPAGALLERLVDETTGILAAASSNLAVGPASVELGSDCTFGPAPAAPGSW